VKRREIRKIVETDFNSRRSISVTLSARSRRLDCGRHIIDDLFEAVAPQGRSMSSGSHKWVIGLGLAVLLTDIVVPHRMLAAQTESPQQASVSQHLVPVGFANERQWLFAHRHFRNRCVLEAMAGTERPAENSEPASENSSDAMSHADLRVASSN
jgi:hypothetical protein